MNLMKIKGKSHTIYQTDKEIMTNEMGFFDCLCNLVLYTPSMEHCIMFHITILFYYMCVYVHIYKSSKILLCILLINILTLL